ncbi:Serine/threonine-protein phosphatase 2A 56 kDa regulatory subunit gamma isoform [Nosema granulosis]|uniref:Serine/threonine-protein phosphatase 2A 56 kDa regulatory subunit gamma isoform n=1 Tax=Nosema granulosis TaxID=83296 RepID=A0A9P6L0H1_9MICR|nr:Serine/threonine-protein phosphatase 2A 56 kDa regulatory subunit gamma isoform [Nosema granulosis]
MSTEKENNINKKRKLLELPREKRSCKNSLARLFSQDPFDLFNLHEDMKKYGVEDKVVEVALSRAKHIMFREIKPVNPTGEAYNCGDDIVVRNKMDSNINIFSRILMFLTALNKPRILQMAFTDFDLVRLFELLKSEDEVERVNVGQSIQNLFDQKISQEKIKSLIENELSLFLHGIRTHTGLPILLHLFSYTGPIREEAYIENILWFMQTPHLDLLVDFKDIVRVLCKDNSKRTILTIKFILHIFENVDSLSKVTLVEILVILLPCIDSIESIIPGLCALINTSILSDHHLLLEEAIGIFETPEIYKLIKPFIDQLLPPIFPALYSLSKKYWRKKGKVRVFKNISLILSMNHLVFEECLIKYNKKRKEPEKGSSIEIVERCLEHSTLEKKKEEEFNKNRYKK